MGSKDSALWIEKLLFSFLSDPLRGEARYLSTPVEYALNGPSNPLSPPKKTAP